MDVSYEEEILLEALTHRVVVEKDNRAIEPLIKLLEQLNERYQRYQRDRMRWPAEHDAC